jgi:hypothetical protein
MKKLIAAALFIVMLSVSALPSFACRRRYYRSYYRTGYSRSYYRPVRYRTVRYRPVRSYYSYRYHHRSFWDKHRDKLTLAMGTGGGALVGGLVGGRRGAGIGALAGLGGSALYTYGLRNRRHRY